MRNRKFKSEGRAVGLVLAVWGAGVLLTLAFWGTVIWAIVSAVQHFTG